MNLHTLQPAQGSVHKEKRLGRGEASGKGGTATKGNKGAQSNTGYASKRGHEGGQMPIQRRMPKRGFKSLDPTNYVVFNIGQLDTLVEKYGLQDFSLENLYMNGLISRTAKVKVLGQGELKAKVTVRVNAISEKAKQLIEAAGGSIELV
ncbi:50S ribosomal protein L15 [Chitinophaga sancti]|uniref:Large ribosomal subunit protein uL15 n=1 Tax=Chitinophaga sancti TaxID=1004 RepID=A0A1K1QAN6_9BACT|nr:50S ribosomal protein L15 [Chitinophaga sancti]WQD61291.1 50S ribosomal protein L15 [Chitinophaga sancti]WQG86582.1 50S ribosomal protein L15 [Chitinophaga sancti]SFW56788.1 large subunit ribosomal protein L15 [Chitinophaga sancti]